MAAIGKFKSIKWTKYWSGGWSVLTCSYFGEQYTVTLGEQLGFAMPHSMIIVHKGQSACYMDSEQLIKFRKYLAGMVIRDRRKGLFWAEKLKENADRIMKLMAGLKKEPVNSANYKKFLKELYCYVGSHLFVKNVVEFLPKKLMAVMFGSFHEARVHAEKVYTESERYMQYVAGEIGMKEKIKPELILCLTKEEISDYWGKGKLPAEKTLRERHENCAYLFEKGKYEMLAGKRAVKFEEEALCTGETAEVSGKTGFAGKAVGTAKIVLDPKSPPKFEEGDILIAGMTRPEYISLMKKSAAIVTDAGGILCHAAIVAREMRKPCVIGTEKATKVFRDGDKVEVDANKGTVRKIV